MMTIFSETFMPMQALPRIFTSGKQSFIAEKLRKTCEFDMSIDPNWK